MRRLTALFGLSVAAIAASFPAQASDRWEEAGSGAVAILPVPSKVEGIVGGSLVCAEQRWTLRLRTTPREGARAETAGRLTIDKEEFPVSAGWSGSALSIAVGHEVVDALKAGSRLTVSVGTEPDARTATFALRNSRNAIAAITPRCSQPDMSAYEQVSLSAEPIAVSDAQALLAEEVELFRAATTATPALTAAVVEVEPTRRLLFASLCGSSWYYGRTGCTLFGYARAAIGDPWREVYNSEGATLFVDPKTSKGGWPDLVTLPTAGDREPLRWSWTGDAYALPDPQVAEDKHSTSATVTP